MRVTDLDHVVLRCRAIDQTLEFYQRVLGLTEERRLDSIGLIQLRAGRSMLDLIPMEPNDGGEAGGNLDHFCLGIETDDIAALARQLQEMGVEVLGEPQERYGARGTGWSVYIRDPEGNKVELKQVQSV
jgi:catechol 2,3-dioxygenase-like lactoylglutathione lyase family enzyme